MLVLLTVILVEDAVISTQDFNGSAGDKSLRETKGTRIGGRIAWAGFLMLVLSVAASAQKVKVGYDKSADFSKYHTYFLAQPGTPATRPFLYATVIGTILDELKTKGFERSDKDADLILIGSGGMQVGINAPTAAPIVPSWGGPAPFIDAGMWTGTGWPSIMTTTVPEGTLVLDFVDRRTNKVVWSGMVMQKLSMENKEDSLEHASKAVTKLLKEFPPKTSAK